MLTLHRLLFIQYVEHKRTGQTVQCLVVTVAKEKPVTMSSALVFMDAMKDLPEISVKQVSMCNKFRTRQIF